MPRTRNGCSHPGMTAKAITVGRTAPSAAPTIGDEAQRAGQQSPEHRVGHAEREESRR